MPKPVISEIAEIKTDLKWIKDGIKVMHEKQDKTNGRIQRLEGVQDDYVQKKDYSFDKQLNLNNRTKLLVALISGIISLMIALLTIWLPRILI